MKKNKKTFNLIITFAFCIGLTIPVIAISTIDVKNKQNNDTLYESELLDEKEPIESDTQQLDNQENQIFKNSELLDTQQLIIDKTQNSSINKHSSFVVDEAPYTLTWNDVDGYMGSASDWILQKLKDPYNLTAQHPNIVIPDKLPNPLNPLDYLPVGQIEFQFAPNFTTPNTTLKSVDFNEAKSLYSISNRACANCTALSGDLNLIGCWNLQHLSDFAFYNSGYTGNLYLPSGIRSIGDSVFLDCHFTGKLNLNVFDKLFAIGSSAFANCSGFVDGFNIPSNVTQIGSSAFLNCTGLTGEIDLTNVKNLGSKAFSGCTGLKKVTSFYKQLLSMPDGLFSGCTALEGDIDLSSYEYMRNIEAFAFANCTNLKSKLIFPPNLMTIGDSAFTKCNFNCELSFPNKLEWIGSESFSNCSNLTGGLNFSECSRFTNIGDSAFYMCKNFTGELKFSKSLKTIGNSAFEENKLVGSIDFSLTKINKIGERAFFGASQFNYLAPFPSTLTNIGKEAFSGCFSLTGDIDLSATAITKINKNTFFGCSAINGKLNMPNTVKEILFQSFFGCGIIGIEHFSNILTSIGPSAFEQCINLKGTLDFSNTKIETIDYNVFKGCTALDSSILLPETILIIGQEAFSNCPNLGYVYFSGKNAPISINDRAFDTYNPNFKIYFPFDGVGYENIIHLINPEATFDFSDQITFYKSGTDEIIQGDIEMYLNESFDIEIGSYAKTIENYPMNISELDIKIQEGTSFWDDNTFVSTLVRSEGLTGWRYNIQFNGKKQGFKTNLKFIIKNDGGMSIASEIFSLNLKDVPSYAESIQINPFVTPEEGFKTGESYAFSAVVKLENGKTETGPTAINWEVVDSNGNSFSNPSEYFFINNTMQQIIFYKDGDYRLKASARTGGRTGIISTTSTEVLQLKKAVSKIVFDNPNISNGIAGKKYSFPTTVTWTDKPVTTTTGLDNATITITHKDGSEINDNEVTIEGQNVIFNKKGNFIVEAHSIVGKLDGSKANAVTSVQINDATVKEIKLSTDFKDNCTKNLPVKFDIQYIGSDDEIMVSAPNSAQLEVIEQPSYSNPIIVNDKIQFDLVGFYKIRATYQAVLPDQIQIKSNDLEVVVLEPVESISITTQPPAWGFKVGKEYEFDAKTIFSDGTSAFDAEWSAETADGDVAEVNGNKITFLTNKEYTVTATTKGFSKDAVHLTSMQKITPSLAIKNVSIVEPTDLNKYKIGQKYTFDSQVLASDDSIISGENLTWEINGENFEKDDSIIGKNTILFKTPGTYTLRAKSTSINVNGEIVESDPLNIIVESYVTDIKITSNISNMTTNVSYKFEAEINGATNFNNEVTWSTNANPEDVIIQNEHSLSPTITFYKANETGYLVTVEATSKGVDNTIKSATTAPIIVSDFAINSIESIDGEVSYRKNSPQTFIATFDDLDTISSSNKQIKWKAIDSNGNPLNDDMSSRIIFDNQIDTNSNSSVDITVLSEFYELGYKLQLDILVDDQTISSKSVALNLDAKEVNAISSIFGQKDIEAGGKTELFVNVNNPSIVIEWKAFDKSGKELPANLVFFKNDGTDLVSHTKKVIVITGASIKPDSYRIQASQINNKSNRISTPINITPGKIKNDSQMFDWWWIPVGLGIGVAVVAMGIGTGVAIYKKRK